MLISLTQEELSQIDNEARKTIAETFFPHNYDCADDLKNYTPTDMTRDRDGNLISGKFLSSDLSVGAPSPGIWGFFVPLSIFSTILMAMTIMAVGYFSFIPFAEGWHTLSGGMRGAESLLYVLWDITLYFVILNAVLAIPTLAVISLLYLTISEQEMTKDFTMVFWIVATAFLAILVLPGSGLVLALIAGTHGALKQMISGRWLLAILIGISPFLGAIVALLVACVGIFYFQIFFYLVDRSRQQSLKDGSEKQKTDAMRKDIEAMEATRKKQAETSLMDNSPFFAVGHSVGVLRRDGDVLTPDPEAILGLTLNDLSMHLFVAGRSGTGKTLTCLKPIIAQWITCNAGGVFVCDPGKSELPHDVADILDMVVTPKNSKINMLSGVDPEVASAILFKAFVQNKGEIWDNTAEQDIRTALFVLDYVRTECPWMSEVAPYCMRSLYRFVSDERYRIGVLDYIPPPSGDDQEHLKLAWTHWLEIVPMMPKETRGSVEFTVRSWLANFVLHHDMGRWADADSDVDIPEFVATGGKIGVECSVSTYGNGGPMALSMIKEGIYCRVNRRAGTKWKTVKTEKPLLFVMDECAEGVGQSDIAFVRIARSLGCTLLYGVQEYGSLTVKFSESTSAPTDAMKAFLNNFSSRITFITDDDTLEAACVHAGQRSRWVPDEQTVQSQPLMSSVRADHSLGDTQWNRGHLKDRVSSYFGILTGAKRSVSTDLHAKNDEENSLIHSASVKGQIKVRNTIDREELSTRLEHAQYALVVLKRAGAIRREVCDTSMWFPRAPEKTTMDTIARIQNLVEDHSAGQRLLEHKS